MNNNINNNINNSEMVLSRVEMEPSMKREEFLAVLCDFYKTSHDRQYNEKISKIYASFIPRMTRFDKIDHVLMFGLQGFIKEHLMHDFDVNFFKLPRHKFESLMKDLEQQLLASVPDISYINLQKFYDLYELGYLPITINALPEGLLVPIKVPVFEVISEGKFAWVGNFLETYMSTELWYPMTVGAIAYEYRKLVDEFLKKTSDFTDSSKGNISEFGSRGNTSWQSGLQASAAWLTCHDKSSNVGVESYLKSYYDMEDHVKGMISTEHSVMCSNYAIDGDEQTFLKKLLTEIYPHGNISVVMDSYDYWNVVENILPELKNEIMNRNGCLYVRGDSGNPIDIVTETVFKLWDIFGGTVNSKGYKVLDKHIRAVYGDSITLNRAKKIFKILEENGFDITNVSLGAGSFSMLCLEEEDGTLKPFTRDSFGFALKTTLVVYDDGSETGRAIPVVKQPKTDNENFKKSYSGRVAVVFKDTNTIMAMDGLDHNEIILDNLLQPVFKNGKLLRNETLSVIRNRINEQVEGVSKMIILNIVK